MRMQLLTSILNILAYVLPKMGSGGHEGLYPWPLKTMTCGANDIWESEKVHRDSKPSQADSRCHFRAIAFVS